MASANQHSAELDVLLEKWCEDRLSAQEVARLEQLVLADDEAMRRFLDYVHLHGTLYWDAASAAEAPRGGVTEVAAEAAIVLHRAKEAVAVARRRAVLVTLCASVLLVSVAGFWIQGLLANRDENRIAQWGPGQMSAGDKNEPADSVHTDDLSGRHFPIVRLTPRPAGASVEDSPDSTEQIPSATHGRELDGEIVTFIDEQLERAWASNDIRPSSLADDGEWLRRVTLDLTGRIPSLSELEEFERNPDPDKRAHLVDRLLSDDRFAEHFTTVWANELVGRSPRTAHERHGLQTFLLDQFRRNRPWSETAAELISAEGSVRENGAAGFLMAHLNNQAVPATAITARLLLGQQLQCTQCHKHPWNDWSQDQFWNLNAFFQQTRIQNRQMLAKDDADAEVEPVLINEAVGGPTYFEDRRGVMQVTFPVFAGTEVDPGPETNRRRELAALLTSSQDDQMARAFVNRMWERFFGYGFTNPVDDMGPHNPPSHAELLNRLTEEFIVSGYDVQELVRWIVSTQAYQLSGRFGEANSADDPASGGPPLFSRMRSRKMTPSQVFDSLHVARWGTSGSEVPYEHRRDEREAWVQQFVEMLENEENGETNTFGESLSQALAMINGSLVGAALSGEPETVFGQILTARIDDEERIRRLCRAAVAREPSPQEMARFRRLVGQAKASSSSDPRSAVTEVLRDIYWAYLNSSEFVTIR